MLFLRLSTFIAISLLTTFLCAEELQENYPTTRANGMGGASTAISNDPSAIWTNPAGISRVRKARAQSLLHRTELPNLVIGTNGQGSSLFSSPSGISKSDLAESMGNTSEASRPIWLQTALNPIAIFSSSKYSAPFAFGMYTNNRMSIIVDNGNDSDSSNDTALVESVSDLGLVLGNSFSTASNRFNVGFSVRPFKRYSYNDKMELSRLLSTSQLQSTIERDSNSGQGIGIDAGLMWTIADFWFPTIAISVLNLPTGCHEEYLNPFEEVRQTVCGTVISGSISNEDDTFLVVPTDFRFGLSIVPRITNKVALRFAFDMHHLYFNSGTSYYGLSGISVMRQIHAGVEAFLGNPLQINPLSLRVGINEGFLTTGISVRLAALAIEIASYGQDVSATEVPREDKRLLVTVTADF